MSGPAPALVRARAAAAVAAGDRIEFPVDPATGGIPVVNIAPATDRTATGTLQALDSAVQINSQGTSVVTLSWTNGAVFTGTIVAEVSNDAGVTWDATVFEDTSGAVPPALSISFAGAAQAATNSKLIRGGGFALTRVRASVGGGATTLPVALEASTAVNAVKVEGYPLAAALADATTNPTLTQIGAWLSGFNGVTWDRIRALGDNAANVALGKVPTLPVVATAAVPLRTEGNVNPLSAPLNGALRVDLASNAGTTAAALADAFANPTTAHLAAELMGFNTVTWDRIRASRTAGATPTGYLNALACGLFSAPEPILVAGQSAPVGLTENARVIVSPSASVHLFDNTGAAGLLASRVAAATARYFLRTDVINSTAGIAGWIMVFNAAVLPPNGTVPRHREPIGAAGSKATIDAGAFTGGGGELFPAGVVIALSTTADTLTVGAATCIFDTVTY